MKIIKRVGLIISFVSLNLIILFITKVAGREIDNPVLLFIFAVSIIGLNLMNGYSHGKLLSKLQ